MLIESTFNDKASINLTFIIFIATIIIAPDKNKLVRFRSENYYLFPQKCTSLLVLLYSNVAKPDFNPCHDNFFFEKKGFLRKKNHQSKNSLARHQNEFSFCILKILPQATDQRFQNLYFKILDDKKRFFAEISLVHKFLINFETF